VLNEKNFPEPFWSDHGPELLDISITNWCDKGCKLCYRNSHQNGEYISLVDLKIVLNQAKKMHVNQIALGGGNPNSHPDFIEILRTIREDYSIIPTYTTNGRNLTNEILSASKEYCGAVAVSVFDLNESIYDIINSMINYEIKTNIHYILTSDSIETVIEWLKEPGILPDKLNAIIFLNYKPVGNNKSKNLLFKNSPLKEKFFDLINNNQYPFKIGFDSCLVSGISKYTSINEQYFEACEAGRFSAFISEDLKLFPCSFMIENHEGIDLRKVDFLQAWQESVLFNSQRVKLKSTECDCEKIKTCLGGCPVFKEINLCE